jgi:3-deoxy-D-manno-octulosonate 8-phosphate phosphatase (KDO 8-P phosphatase)
MKIDYYALAKKYQDKITPLKVFLFDVDGILTTGHIFFQGGDIGYNRCFHTHDGYGLKILMRAGYKVGVISGGDSVGVTERFKNNLKLDYIFLGNEDKREAYKAILADGYKDEEILYMGDEFFDMPLLKKAGFSATVPSASDEVQEVADYVTTKNSGSGCVREVIEIIRKVKNITPEVPDFD